MKLSNSSALALAVAIIGAQTWATTAAEHNIRHSGGAASTPAAKTTAAKSKQAMASKDAQNKFAQEIHSIWSFQ